MLIGIVGLGLIGGSFAKAYTRAGHTVAAYDIDPSVLRFALIDGAVSQELTAQLLSRCDLILICTYPQAAIEYMRQFGSVIGQHPVVIDCCGVKREITREGMRLAKQHGFTYAGGHPMAGTQHSGYKYARADLFVHAPMVIVPPDHSDIVLLGKIKELLSPAGFGQITVSTAEKHDERIAFTSQLAHIVSSAYIKSPTALEHKGVSAGSYRDMTRVAHLNPPMWTELCMDNKDYLLRELTVLIDNLEAYRSALEQGNAPALERLFTEGAKRKKEIDG